MKEGSGVKKVIERNRTDDEERALKHMKRV